MSGTSPDKPGHDGKGENVDARDIGANTRLPLPLAGEVDALAERGGWGKSLFSLPGVTPPPPPSPASGRGGRAVRSVG